MKKNILRLILITLMSFPIPTNAVVVIEETGEFENPVIIDYSLDGEVNQKETKIDKIIEGTIESSLVNEIKHELNPVFLEEHVGSINDIKPSKREYQGSVTKIGSEPFHLKTPAFNIDGKFIKNVDLGFGYQGNLAYDWRIDKQFSFYDAPDTWVSTIINFQDNKTSFTFSMDPVPESSDDNYFVDAISNFYLRHKINGNQTITLGRTRSGVGFEGKLSKLNQLFIDKAQIGDWYSDVRSVGVVNDGSYKYFDYQVGIFNSNRQFLHSYDGLDFNTWLSFKPFAGKEEKYGNLVVGTGVNAGKNQTDYATYGTYVGYSYKKFLANFEAAVANKSNGETFLNTDSYGLYTTLGYNLTPKLQFVTRYDFFDPNSKTSNDSIVKYSAGLNYYFHKQHLKFSLNYVFETHESEEDINKILFLTQFAL